MPGIESSRSRRCHYVAVQIGQLRTESKGAVLQGRETDVAHRLSVGGYRTGARYGRAAARAAYRIGVRRSGRGALRVNPALLNVRPLKALAAGTTE